MSEKHTYPKSFGPSHHLWSIRMSWAILDQIEPGVIPDKARWYLAGLVGGAMQELYQMGLEGRDPAKHPVLRDAKT